MEKKTVKTKRQKAVDPFAEMAKGKPTPASSKTPAKTVKRAWVTETEAVKPATPRAKRVVKKIAQPTADAFAEIAPVSSPVAIAASADDLKPDKKRVLEKAAGANSVAAEKPKRVRKASAKTKTVEATPIVEASVLKSTVEVSPVFKALADVSLPELRRENRARLMLQSPTKLYFYWSVRENPYQLLRNALGTDIGSYTLVVKLTDQANGTDEMYPAEPEGQRWFTVEPDREYRAEMGFYATNRPYFRIVYSNTIETPRRSPSPHPASDARWTVSANKFAEVLDVSGFKRDAIDVAIAGDEPQHSTDASHNAFAHFIGRTAHLTRGIADAEVRNVLASMASGSTLETVRHQVSPELFGILQANSDRLTAVNAQAALGEYFNVDDADWSIERHGAVFGSSLIHFPTSLKARALRPVSS